MIPISEELIRALIDATCRINAALDLHIEAEGKYMEGMFRMPELEEKNRPEETK